MSDTDTTTERKTLNFKIDGKDYTAFEGESVLQAALRNGVFIPHYCWHPGLGVDGNCRMCLVYTKPGPPKPDISCNSMVREGMEVDSSSAQIKKDREGVLEFLLANHPLDCPICDQAGECDLQQYSFDHGRETSQFVENKTQHARKDFGPFIRYNGNRCITCTRCTRFTSNVTGTGELAVVHRTDSAKIDVFPGLPLDNPLSGCVADLCPVGALLETDSIHTTRVWLLRGTKSVCGGCATGCNVNLEVFDEEVKRITPRENQAVNRWWMCDAGRLSRHEAMSETRLVTSRIDGEPASSREALDAAIKALRGASDGEIGGLVTGYATNEELFLLKTLVGRGALGAAFRPEGESFDTRDGFHLHADKNPNRAGLTKILGEVGDASSVEASIKAGKTKVLLVLDGIPGGSSWSPTAFEGDDLTRIVISFDDGALARAAEVAIPALHWMEKDGSFVNFKGRLQRVRAAVPAPEGARTELDLLQEMARAMGQIPRVVSAGGVFRRLAVGVPAVFGGLNYNQVGDAGVPLPGATDTTPPEACQTYYEAGPVSRGPGRALDEQTRISVHRESPVGYGTIRGSV